ncbi:unnamed protein product [Dracunculus medinensis]|uniref:Chitin-binding type-2 domain-containing protein n=1 Tax=Dracunculus medinensis TaxID=318479 RepID=A0A0N4UPS7_DRAME|nr:unnamed protein product [Dracunculus medinensis]
MFKRIGCVLLFLTSTLIFSSTGLGPEEDYLHLCQEANETFFYPYDCHKYVKCTNFQPEILQCPDGDYFDPQTFACAPETVSSVVACNELQETIYSYRSQKPKSA